MLPSEDPCHKCSKNKGSSSLTDSSNLQSSLQSPVGGSRKIKTRISILKRKKNTPGYETGSQHQNTSSFNPSNQSKRQRPSKLCVCPSNNSNADARLSSPSNAFSPSLTLKRRKGSIVSPTGLNLSRNFDKQEGFSNGSPLSNLGSPSSECQSPTMSSNLKLFSSKDNSPSFSQASYCSPNADYSTNQLWTLPEIGGPEIYFSVGPDTISRENWTLASSWISVIGRDLTGCLLSKDWSLRESGLKGLSRTLANALNQHRHSNGGDPQLEKLWRTTVEVLFRSLEDKIFRVYQGALKALQTLITLTHCPCFLSEAEFKSLLKPLIQRIIIKCSDGKRRVADLSYSVISELCKGDSGELALGKHVYHERAHLRIENEYFQKTIFEPGGESAAGAKWQWVLGVAFVLDRLLDENEEDLLNQNFISMMINFAFKHLNHSHTNVSKLSRRILIKAAKAASDVSLFHYVWSSLSSLDLTQQNRIKKELRSHYNRISSTTEHMYLKAVTLSQEVAKGMNNLRKLKESVLTQNLPYDVPQSFDEDDPLTQQHILIHPHSILMDGSLYEYPQGLLYLENRDWTKGPLLGTGAYSACFQARDMRTGTIMAVKQIPLNSHNAEASISEVELLSSLGFNPHIIRLLGAIRENDSTLNVFIEWMSGGSISHILDIYGAFEERVIVGYVKQLLMGLDFLHGHSVLHRDIKGANLLLDNTGHHLKIGDFGAAVCLKSIPEGSSYCELRGTIPFMAPEVIRGENYGFKSDIWSVGCVIIEMATQKPPWNTLDISNHLALIYKIAQSIDPPNIPSHLSVECLDCLLSCLNINQDERPSASQLMKHPIFYNHMD